MLASPHYGERWGRHWLDVVRFGESEGYETNLPRPPPGRFASTSSARSTATRRSRVSFSSNWRATRWAARGLIQRGARRARSCRHLSDADWLTEAATGFLVGGAHDVVGNQTLEGMLQQRADDLDDMITATGTTFLGLTIQCARCHDHKFDPITQKDYYGLQAILAGVNHGEREVRAPDSEARRRQAAPSQPSWRDSKRSSIRRAARRSPGRDQAVRPMVSSIRNVERFAPVPARMVPHDNPGDEQSDRALP